MLIIVKKQSRFHDIEFLGFVVKCKQIDFRQILDSSGVLREIADFENDDN